MSHPLNISDLIVGGMLMLSTTFAYFWTRNRPELIRGLTYRQFVWCIGVGFLGWSDNCLHAVLHLPVSKTLFGTIAIVGLLISGLLCYFGEHMPLRLIVPTSLASAILMFFIGWFLRKRGILK